MPSDPTVAFFLGVGFATSLFILAGLTAWAHDVWTERRSESDQTRFTKGWELND